MNSTVGKLYKIIYPGLESEIFLPNDDYPSGNCSYRFIVDTVKKYQHWEYDFFDPILKHIPEGSTVLDIGCNVGTYTLAFSHAVGDAGQVHAFDPQPYCKVCVDMSVEHNNISNVKMHRICMGSVESDTVLFLGNDSGLSLVCDGKIDFGSIPDKMETKLRKGERIDVTEVVRSQIGNQIINNKGDLFLSYEKTKTIDSLSLDNVSFIKIDVEGYAPHVFEGGIETIKKYKPVIFTDQLHDILPQLNYSITSLHERSGEEMKLCVPR
jgi:FkbM family methyltransferase